MKNIVQKLILIIAVLMLLFSINTRVLALSEIISDGDSFLGEADSSYADVDPSEMQELSGFLYNMLLSAGVVIAVIVATALGIQFMIGGAEGQAKVKEMIIPFVVGCVIVFGGFGFWKIAISVGGQLNNSGGTSSDLSIKGSIRDEEEEVGAGRRSGNTDDTKKEEGSSDKTMSNSEDKNFSNVAKGTQYNRGVSEAKEFAEEQIASGTKHMIELTYKVTIKNLKNLEDKEKIEFYNGYADTLKSYL